MEEFGKRLFRASRNSHPTRARVLEQAAEGMELVVKILHVVSQSCHLHGGVRGIDLEHTRSAASYHTRHLRISHKSRRGNLIDGYLMDEEFGVKIIVGLHHVYLALDELRDFLYLLLVAPCGDGVLVDAGYAERGGIDAFYVDLLSGEDRRHLTEDARHVLGIDKQGVEFLFHFL